MKKTIRMLCIMGLWITAIACEQQFLDKKPNKSQVVPTTLADFQAILDDTWNVVNIAPGLQEIASDNFFEPDQNLQSLDPIERNTYLWAKDLYQGAVVDDWNRTYQSVFNANVVLDGIEKIKPDARTQSEFDRVKGSALFYRAFAFHSLAQVFAAPYDQLTAQQTPGIPIRLSADVSELAGRGTLAQTYEQIIQDLLQAQTLLPETSDYKNRPSKPAVHALLARVYLNMQDYSKAGQSASSCLELYAALLDYNTLDSASLWPFPSLYPAPNKEMIYYHGLVSRFVNYSPLTSVDSVLYASYQDNDLRKNLFFSQQEEGRYAFKGNYTGDWTLFGGLATDEIYLIRAECRVRTGNLQGAADDLNTLLEKRFMKGSFTPLKAGSDQTLLQVVLQERRKELINRGLRWADLRRLNKETAFRKVLTRKVDGQLTELAPGDNRYVFPIPDAEINLSGIEQNPR